MVGLPEDIDALVSYMEIQVSLLLRKVIQLVQRISVFLWLAKKCNTRVFIRRRRTWY